MSPSLVEITYVIDHFDIQADADPTGDMVLWIENLLFELDVPQNPPPKKPPPKSQPPKNPLRLKKRLQKRINAWL